MMRYLMTGITVVSCIWLSACGSKQEGYTENEANAKIDSIVAERIDELNRHYLEDLEKRMAIEVKVKADSIVAARDAGK